VTACGISKKEVRSDVLKAAANTGSSSRFSSWLLKLNFWWGSCSRNTYLEYQKAGETVSAVMEDGVWLFLTPS
jgi:hypothetical protein